MKIKGAMGLTGVIEVLHYRNGNLLSQEVIRNTITNMGKDEVAGLINGTRTGGFRYLAIGNSGTTASAASTALLGEFTNVYGLGRVLATASQVTTDVTNDTAQLVHTFTASASHTVKEAGLFDTAYGGGGRILGRGTFVGKAMEASDSITVTYKIDID